MNKNTTIVLVALLVIVLGLYLYYNNAPMTGDGGGAGLKGLSAGPVVGSVKSGTLGEYLTDTKGMALYVFADDKKLESSCNGECAKNWPPFMYEAEKDPSKYSDMLSKRINSVKRSDGSYQYAYGEKPLYYYVGDKAPGETSGNGMNNGKWSIVVITP